MRTWCVVFITLHSSFNGHLFLGWTYFAVFPIAPDGINFVGKRGFMNSLYSHWLFQIKCLPAMKPGRIKNKALLLYRVSQEIRPICFAYISFIL
jgi:hypothetical protein